MSAATIEKVARKVVDWAAIEPLYRTSSVSISQLAADFRVSRAAIHKHAEKHGWTRELRAQQKARDAHAALLDEVAFNRGRDLCIALLHDADSGNHATFAEAQRDCRDGHAQDRFARRYLVQLLQAPAALDGFAAVLSARLGVCDILPAEHFNLPMAEYETGEVQEAEPALPAASWTELPATTSPCSPDGQATAGLRTLTDRLDEMHMAGSYIQTHTRMLYELLLNDDDLPDLPITDPLSRTYRQFACCEAIRMHAKALQSMADAGRAQASAALEAKATQVGVPA